MFVNTTTVFIARFWYQGRYRGGFCEKLEQLRCSACREKWSFLQRLFSVLFEWFTCAWISYIKLQTHLGTSTLKTCKLTSSIWSCSYGHNDNKLMFILVSSLQCAFVVFNKYLTVYCVIINHFSFPSKCPSVKAVRKFYLHNKFSSPKSKLRQTVPLSPL